jgi:hypothetical protein
MMPRPFFRDRLCPAGEQKQIKIKAEKLTRGQKKTLADVSAVPTLLPGRLEISSSMFFVFFGRCKMIFKMGGEAMRYW